jgi:N utilization substance protein A
MVPVKEQVPRESYRRGDRIRAYILDVLHETRGPQIILSRTHPNFLIHLFRTEVPEIAEGIVNIMGASREAGVRAKIAVASNNSDIDPVGACVGMKGSRVQNVVQELRGEKIDIIPWHLDPAKFVCNRWRRLKFPGWLLMNPINPWKLLCRTNFYPSPSGKKGKMSVWLPNYPAGIWMSKAKPAIPKPCKADICQKRNPLYQSHAKRI